MSRLSLVPMTSQISKKEKALVPGLGKQHRAGLTVTVNIGLILSIGLLLLSKPIVQQTTRSIKQNTHVRFQMFEHVPELWVPWGRCGRGDNHWVPPCPSSKPYQLFTGAHGWACAPCTGPEPEESIAQVGRVSFIYFWLILPSYLDMSSSPTIIMCHLIDVVIFPG